MSQRLAIFDCDGTLIDGQASICEAMEAAFARLSMAAPLRNDIRRAVGLSLNRAVNVLAPDASEDTQAALVEAYKNAFRDARAEGRLEQPLVPGIREVIDALEDAGWLLAVATGMSDRGLANVLATHELTGRFISLQTADRHPSKPDPSMIVQALADAGAEAADAVMIGDTTYDIAMAGNAGAVGVGVAWGYHAPLELTGEGAAFVAEEPAQLTGFLLR